MDEDRDHGLMISLHRHCGGSRVKRSLWPGLEPDEWRQAVAQGAPIRPDPSSTPISIGEGMDANPFAMNVGAEGEHGPKLRLIGRAPGNWDHPIQHGDSPSHSYFEVFELLRYKARFDSPLLTDMHLLAV